eukprot:scaffold8271_cov171-Amphora_coffeaeformis.AAC.8
MEKITEFQDDQEASNESCRDGRAEEEQQQLAQNENTAVRLIRLFTALVLVAATTVVSLVVYDFTRDKEVQDFEDHFSFSAGKVVDQFKINAERRISALQAFSAAHTTWAKYSNESFPFVTLPEFERSAAYTIELAQVLSIMTFPIVQTEQRQAWEAYSVEHYGWMAEGMALQPNVDLDGEAEGVAQLNSQNPIAIGRDPYTDPVITPLIFSVQSGTNQAAPESGPGPYAPIWSMAPAVPVGVILNFNSFRHPSWAQTHADFMKYQTPIVSAAADFADDSDPNVAGRNALLNLFLNRWPQKGEYQAGPVSDLYIPIWDSFDTTTRTLASIMNVSMPKERAREMKTLNISHTFKPRLLFSVVAILENTCGQEFTYHIDGPSASYVGPGAHYDKSYEHLMVETGFGALLGAENVNQELADKGLCYYNLRIYPQSDLEEEYLTTQPIVLTCILIGVFIFTSVVFIIYDCLVQRRHRVVNDTAVQSTAVVSSLFPQAVRDRVGDMYHPGTNKQASLMDMAAQKVLSDAKESEMDDSVPIADLYDQCTVLFADVAGFTEWSSERSPVEVFKLLETLYGAFDRLAKKHNVFKVETIGDCYVAATGLPKPQPRHAVIMCRFARECIQKMNELMPLLVERLGEDTKQLSMRFGLHSGPVTAGVLRGDKARFQLFGDTVNTASRMESNGKPNRIHVSQETADILIKMGKSFWLEKRSDKIEAKGKGKMQTYFCSIDVASAASSSYAASSSVSGDSNDGTDEVGVAPEAAEDAFSPSPPPIPPTPRSSNPLPVSSPDEDAVGDLENWTNL